MANGKEMMSAMKASIKANYRQQAKQQKSDDIIEFIKANWKLFTARRSEMAAAVQSLGSPGIPYSVDGLCDVLGIPDNVLFKRSPVKDVGNAVLNFPNTKLYEIFDKCYEARGQEEICLFIVAGKSSIVITNMPIQFPPDDMICYLPAGLGINDIQIFRAADAPYRLPHLFQHDEETYD